MNFKKKVVILLFFVILVFSVILIFGSKNKNLLLNFCDSKVIFSKTISDFGMEIKNIKNDCGATTDFSNSIVIFDLKTNKELTTIFSIRGENTISNINIDEKLKIINIDYTEYDSGGFKNTIYIQKNRFKDYFIGYNDKTKNKDECVRSIPEQIIIPDKVSAYSFILNDSVGIEEFSLKNKNKKVVIKNWGCEHYVLDLSFLIKVEKNDIKNIYKKSNEILTEINSVMSEQIFDKFILAFKDYILDPNLSLKKKIYTNCKNSSYCLEQNRAEDFNFLEPHMILSIIENNKNNIKVQLRYQIGPL